MTQSFIKDNAPAIDGQTDSQAIVYLHKMSLTASRTTNTKGSAEERSLIVDILGARLSHLLRELLTFFMWVVGRV